MNHQEYLQEESVLEMITCLLGILNQGFKVMVNANLRTVLQYATYLFGKSDDNLYKYLEGTNILCEDALFPSSVRITNEVEAWATTENPSTSSKFFFS